MFVKPRAGIAVRDPELRDLLPAEGREVARNDYWLRRVLDGDVVETASQVPPADKKEAR